jgi:CTP:molybdopterin cytidylyltransferase MocA
MGPAFAVILAAGASERLGQPKAMVPILIEPDSQNETAVADEMPLIRWLVERLEKSGAEVIIVTRQDLVVSMMMTLPGRTVVVNSKPEAGRTGTLQCGIRAILDGKKKPKNFRLLVVPVDRPGFSESTLTALLESDHSCCPAKDGRGGHPLLLIGEDLGRIMNAKPEQQLRELTNPIRINVVDEFLHFNLDKNDDLAKLNSVINSI